MTKPFVPPIGMTKFLDTVSKKVFGHTLTEAIAKSICLSCGRPAKKFKDELSRKEYFASGFCSICQDEAFEEQKSKEEGKNGS